MGIVAVDVSRRIREWALRFGARGTMELRHGHSEENGSSMEHAWDGIRHHARGTGNPICQLGASVQERHRRRVVHVSLRQKQQQRWFLEAVQRASPGAGD